MYYNLNDISLILLKNGADLNSQNSYNIKGKTPLDFFDDNYKFNKCNIYKTLRQEFLKISQDKK
jgi:hypothetical protein